MILTKEIEITLNSANMNHFKSLGYYNLKKGNKLIVPIEYLNIGSHSIVDVKCDFCEKEKKISYKDYIKSAKNQNLYCCSFCIPIKAKNTNIEKYGIEHYNNIEKIKQSFINKYGEENPSNIDEFKDKRKNTMIEKYGVEFYVLSNDFKDKSEKTSMINYGTIHPIMSDKMKEIKKDYYIKNGFNVTTKDFELYKNKIYRLTKKNKQILLNNWNGFDYYDNEYIKDNFNLPYYDKNYPTIDHKLSIFDGYKNNISVEEIADLKNLCFTKRFINSKKYIKSESIFIF